MSHTTHTTYTLDELLTPTYQYKPVPHEQTQDYINAIHKELQGLIDSNELALLQYTYSKRIKSTIASLQAISGGLGYLVERAFLVPSLEWRVNALSEVVRLQQSTINEMYEAADIVNSSILDNLKQRHATEST